MSLRKRIANSPALNNAVTRLIEGWVRLVHRTSRWERHGFEALDAVLERGEPVICALWHDRLVMSPYVFPTDRHPICTITSDARAGTLVGQVQTRFGYDTIRMSSHKRHVALSREVIGKMRAGSSIGIAVDGPRGPSREAKIVPLMWARSTGRRIFICTYSTRRAGRLPAWDRMLLPGLFNRGVFMCREFSQSVPRKPSEAEMEALRLALEEEMNALTAEADALTGLRG